MRDYIDISKMVEESPILDASVMRGEVRHHSLERAKEELKKIADQINSSLSSGAYFYLICFNGMYFQEVEAELLKRGWHIRGWVYNNKAPFVDMMVSPFSPEELGERP